MAFRRMLEQVTIVQSTDPEIFEALRALGIDGIVELAGIGFDELQHALVDQTHIKAGANGLGEGIDSEALDFFVDEGGQQPRGELGIRRFVGHEGGGGADG